jgi:hypothetical protein
MKSIDRVFNFFLSERAKVRGERLILTVAILSFILHLILILLETQGVINTGSKFLQNPIAAIYTPFSFILIYEVYLLVFFLPKSISFYIGKQYEIITFIVIRRIFKDISHLELTSSWFENQNDLQFTFDALTSLVLFVLIFFFYKNILKRQKSIADEQDRKMKRFILLKKGIAVLLVPILIFLAIYTLSDWTQAIISDYQNGVLAFKDINKIFFDEFFTILIIVDVLLLLASFFYSDKFHKVIRNSGFIISTILIKISFSVSGIVNDALVIGAVLFGFLILLIHNMYEKKGINQSKSSTE